MIGDGIPRCAQWLAQADASICARIGLRSAPGLEPTSCVYCPARPKSGFRVRAGAPAPRRAPVAVRNLACAAGATSVGMVPLAVAGQPVLPLGGSGRHGGQFGRRAGEPRLRFSPAPGITGAKPAAPLRSRANARRSRAKAGPVSLQAMNSAEIRERFLKFFESNGAHGSSARLRVVPAQRTRRCSLRIRGMVQFQGRVHGGRDTRPVPARADHGAEVVACPAASTTIWKTSATRPGITHVFSRCWATSASATTSSARRSATHGSLLDRAIPGCHPRKLWVTVYVDDDEAASDLDPARSACRASRCIRIGDPAGPAEVHVR